MTKKVSPLPAPTDPAPTVDQDAAGARVLWMTTPQPHDYPAARSYLSLLAAPKDVAGVIAALKRAPVVFFKAKDILRASELSLLPVDNKHVAADLKQIAAGSPLSPCLLVRGELGRGQRAQIADGYHRVCASYYTDENTDIPVKIAAL